MRSFLPNIIRVIKSTRKKWTGHAVFMGDMRNACKILVGKPKGKSSFRRSRHI
jgi:hypothetical protein